MNYYVCVQDWLWRHENFLLFYNCYNSLGSCFRWPMSSMWSEVLLSPCRCRYCRLAMLISTVLLWVWAVICDEWRYFWASRSAMWECSSSVEDSTVLRAMEALHDRRKERKKKHHVVTVLILHMWCYHRYYRLPYTVGNGSHEHIAFDCMHSALRSSGDFTYSLQFKTGHSCSLPTLWVHFIKVK